MRKLWVRSLGMALAFVFLAVAAQAASQTDQAVAALDANPYGKALVLDPSFNALAQSPSTVALHLVKANVGLIQDKSATLGLHLGPGLDITAHRVDSYFTKHGSLVWSGVIEDPGSVITPYSPAGLQFDAINSVMLVRDGETVTANVHFGGTWYQIRPLKSGDHAVVEVDTRFMPADHPEEYRNLPVVRMPRKPAAQEKADTVIRVMVHWTSAAASASGNISALVDLAVAETNLGYTNSGVLIDVVLAHKSLVSYTESSNFTTNLTRYRSTSDGYMDSIHTTRNSVTADVGVLIVNNSAYCGLASGIGSSASTAFAAVYWGCATGYYSFAHEIGHLQSARHDPSTDPSTSPYSYGHGYRYNGSPDWRTIMAYDCSGGCPRLNYWSSPLRTYNGVPMGTSSQSDNARVLNNTRNTVAAFR